MKIDPVHSLKSPVHDRQTNQYDVALGKKKPTATDWLCSPLLTKKLIYLGYSGPCHDT